MPTSRSSSPAPAGARDEAGRQGRQLAVSGDALRHLGAARHRRHSPTRRLVRGSGAEPDREGPHFRDPLEPRSGWSFRPELQAGPAFLAVMPRIRESNFQRPRVYPSLQALPSTRRLSGAPRCRSPRSFPRPSASRPTAQRRWPRPRLARPPRAAATVWPALEASGGPGRRASCARCTATGSSSDADFTRQLRDGSLFQASPSHPHR